MHWRSQDKEERKSVRLTAIGVAYEGYDRGGDGEGGKADVEVEMEHAEGLSLDIWLWMGSGFVQKKSLRGYLWCMRWDEEVAREHFARIVSEMKEMLEIGHYCRGRISGWLNQRHCYVRTIHLTTNSHSTRSYLIII